MRTSLRSYVLASLLTLVFASCSGSGSTGSLQINCSDGAPFCLVACDLGCGSLGCSITEVAENQRLRFTFNQDVDPASVTGASFSLRTASGIAPDGEPVVDGNTIVFVPAIRVVNGVGTFGFQRNQTYILSIAGGRTPGQSLRSVSGTQLSDDLTCTITATRGIIDEDNAPPSGDLINPTNTQAAPVDATIIVRFSEVIDTTPFLTAVNASTPIQYTLRRSRVDPQTGERECDPSTAPLQIEGLPSVRLEQFNGTNVTVISLKPSFALPGESCIEVRVTGDVRDLSGRSAVPSLHVFFTEPSQVGDINFDETFQNAQNLDQDISGGTWNNGARPAQLGGDGRHGSFNISLGDPIGLSAWQWNTDNFTIPAAYTFSGQSEVVTDGKFYFTDFIVGPGERVRFVGSNPAQIYVRGRTEIHGTVDVNGTHVTAFNAQNSINNFVIVPGQSGAGGGAGGGRGGRGGDRCLGNGPTVSGNIRLEDGRDGESVQLLAGHAYNSQASQTAGKGSQMFPANGLNTSLTHQMSFVFNGQMNWGGSGGGFGGPGQQSSIQPLANLTIPSVAPFNVPAPTGGAGFALVPFPAAPPPNYSSLRHYTVGGSGGGGSGSHAFAALTTQQGKWKAGGGGTGGGGSFVLRGGSVVFCSSTSAFESKGGSGYTINGDNPTTPIVELATQPTSWGISCPGGAGSGGSFLLQSSSDLQMSGSINTSGGQAPSTGGISPPTLNGICNGGDGAAGFYRLEAAGNVITTGASLVPALVPANNVGSLSDRDDASGQVSTWRGTGLIFPPDWVRYELDVDLDGDGSVDVTYSDDPASVPGASGAASDPLGPVTIMFQGSRLETATGLPLPGTQGPWRPFVSANAGPSLNNDAVTGFRFQLLFNTGDYPDAVVMRLRVTARG